MTTPPPCTCARPDGAHDERCAYIRFVRSADYDPDLTVPAFLRREKPPKQSAGGVFD